MRVLLTTYSDKSLLLSMVPLAWALRTAGHDVRLASSPGLAEQVTQAGLTAVPVGRDDGFARVMWQQPKEHAARQAGLLTPYDAADDGAADWSRMQAGYRFALQWWHKMTNFPMIPDLVEFARYWQPDLVLWEPTTYAGGIAAKACGAAHARLLWSIDAFGVTRDHYLRLKNEQPHHDRVDPLADWLGAYADKYGFAYDEELVSGQFTVDQLPRPLRIEAALTYLTMRYTPYGGAAVVPGWLQQPPRRPRIALTLGITASERFTGYTVRVQEILDSLADLDAEVVATIADKERHTLTRIPGNARVVSYVPLHALVPTCSVVIHHAGPGTLCTTALSGVPQLLLPWYFDEPAVARRLAAQGSGITVDPAEATGEVVRDAVMRLLGEPRYREAAGLLRAEMMALPASNAVVGLLEKLTAQHRAR